MLERSYPELDISPRATEVNHARILAKIEAPNIATLMQIVSLVLPP